MEISLLFSVLCAGIQLMMIGKLLPKDLYIMFIKE